ncbi:MAG: sigma 54-interacting transcriptional regulator [Candidatus Glassbacteria bacterium]
MTKVQTTDIINRRDTERLAISNNLGSAMETPFKRENVESLFKIIGELVPERDLEKLLERVIGVSTEILGADRALLFLYDRKSENLIFKYGVNIEEGLIEEAHEFSSSVIDRAREGEAVIKTDAQKDQRLSLADSIKKYNIKTVLCAPLLSDGIMIGVIYADTRGKVTILNSERRSYFLSFVNLVTDVIVRNQELNAKDDELSYLKKRMVETTIFPEIIGESSTLKALKEQILRIVSVDYPVSVLITGESGSGKELIARAIHQAGARSGKAFVVVNCAAIPATLMESELFGHEKGAFTGAHARKQGFFEVADGGVIFLDEIGDLPKELQPKLLRVLQFGTFIRLGGRMEISTDVQVLCATSRDLHREMEEGRFRKALFHRLAVEVVRVPSLRERKDDILLLANQFMKFFSEKMGKPLGGIDVSAQKLLGSHDYRENNVRELKNIMERAVLGARGRSITSKDIVFSEELISETGAQKESALLEDTGDDNIVHFDEDRLTSLFEESKGRKRLVKSEKPFYRVYGVMERKLMLCALRQSGWKIKPAAYLLGLDYSHFRVKVGSIIREVLEETGGDFKKASQKNGIPLNFLKSRLKLAGLASEDKGNPTLS